VGAALNELPAFGVAPSSAANTQAGFGIAQSFVDLYGLGSQRILTLVNGRRFVSESSATLNNANANTANIILKKDYQGLDVDAQVGATGQGDAWNYRTRILAGQ
jgi:iron complex outermembrane recepter protein